MTRLSIAACIAALVVAATAAVAQDSTSIVVGGEIVAHIRTGGPYGSIYQRQAAIDQRITNALSNELKNIFVMNENDPELDGPKLTIAKANDLWTLSIGNQMLIQAYPEDATGSRTTKALIYQWKENFFHAFPLAPSPKDVPPWWTERHPEAAASFEPKPHGMPDEDLTLVREVASVFQAARDMSEDDFTALLPAMEQSVIQLVWTYRHPACGPAPITENIRAKSALKRARGLVDEQYRAEKWWMSGLTIKKLRLEMRMPPGIGPVPEQRDLPDFAAPTGPQPGPVAPGPTADPTQPEPIAEVRLAPGSPLRQVALGTGLGPDNQMLNTGQEFDADTGQLLVYLKIKDARPNTIVGVTIGNGPTIVARRLVRVSGDRNLAVTFYPSRSTTFTAGDYKVLLTVNGEDAGVIPFRVQPALGTLTGG